MDRNEMLKKLMELSFCLLDLNLYLDTHPHDSKMLKKFDELNKQHTEMHHKYVMEYGPIMYTDVTCDFSKWQWINDPWPWQLEN